MLDLIRCLLIKNIFDKWFLQACSMISTCNMISAYISDKSIFSCSLLLFLKLPIWYQKLLSSYMLMSGTIERFFYCLKIDWVVHAYIVNQNCKWNL